MALIPGDYVGWAVCSKNLIRELSKLTETSLISPQELSAHGCRRYDGKIFHTIGDHHLTKVMDVTGTENYGYTFFEKLPAEEAVGNALHFDIVFAGSTWCRDILVEKGITWADVLIQGIDPELFYPVCGEKPGAKDYFVIFSGGKLELRKSQDIVIKAVKVMQQRHKDVLFVNCWYNAWPFTMNTMVHSPWINYRPAKRWGIDWVKLILHDNGIDLNRTEIIPRISQDQMRKIYACTDIGLFPNRCEGGTNLVLMEYMACGKPVVASYTSGHKDVLTKHNSLQLRHLRPFELWNREGKLEAKWEEPDLQEVIETLEYAYENRDALTSIGKQAAEDMKHFTWKHSAVSLLQKLELIL
ncbi:MAG: glycosyltransferase family 4 protein [Deltaproteobacteria bacterium]|nr:glycosyltransferase family 4 protein [Deltaproteobacteria bacterium]